MKRNKFSRKNSRRAEETLSGYCGEATMDLGQERRISEYPPDYVDRPVDHQ